MKLTWGPLPTNRTSRNHGVGAFMAGGRACRPGPEGCEAPLSDAAGRQIHHAVREIDLIGSAVVTVRLITSDQILSLMLDDCAAARDFRSLLPLDLVLSDYHATEKVADLPRRLTTDGAPDGVTPAAGDFAYYAPWGNLALFYRDFRHSPGLVRLGRVEGDPALIGRLNGVIRFEASSRAS